jgi:membrane associated rhomboid family serine protease
VYAIIILNVLAFLFMLGVPREALPAFVHLFGVVPLRFSDPAWAAAMGFPQGGAYTFLTYMFLHGGWLHLLVNMWTMWIFGDNIEDVMGPWRFLVFYVCCGLAALGVHFAFNMHSTLPVVGASGAIAGVMGAYFLLYPHAKVVTLIPIIIIPFIVELPAVLFLGIWFVTQFFSGFSEAVSARTGTIAWWAHAGGFVAGMLLLPIFRRSDRCYYCYGKDQGRPQGPAS